ncbi:hypothetical protein NUW58_g10763 [Xylaria curta]|uniref:Uncharacterized protein n=1 Tax=Xylaria curta TaxID=42375 RepID=A0ACC1MGH9_9PEZI|nr:hypothetical protein NUW58_g10763 [Xylaria curta]
MPPLSSKAQAFDIFAQQAATQFVDAAVLKRNDSIIDEHPHELLLGHHLRHRVRRRPSRTTHRNPWKTPPPNSPELPQTPDQEPPSLPLIPFPEDGQEPEGEYAVYPIGWRRLQFRM